MAVSRTLEPDPGYAGVGTETRIRTVKGLAHFLFSAFAWISALQGLEIVMHTVFVAASRSLVIPTRPLISVG